MNIFAGLTKYAAKWQVKETRTFSEEEIKAVENAVVHEGQYGKSVQFFMVGGGQCYIPMDPRCTLNVGEKVDLTKATIVTLQREGDADISRILI